MCMCTLKVRVHVHLMSMSTITQHYIVGLFAACGQTLLEPSGTFSSPDYDLNNNAFTRERDASSALVVGGAGGGANGGVGGTGGAIRCVWRIAGAFGERVALNITALDFAKCFRTSTYRILCALRRLCFVYYL